MAVMFCHVALPAMLSAGTITLVTDSPEPILHAWAISRVQNDKGVYGQELPGTINPENHCIEFNNLQAGHYDLKFETQTGFIQGWNANVPASDYETEQPIAKASIATLIQKLKGSGASGFDDEVVVLDLQGNIQNAAILTRQLRTRKFVGGNYKKGEWVFRVTRWQWESPDERTWAPWQERPFYALIRERLMPESYRSLRITYARHLGGIALKTEAAKVDLGTLNIPKVQDTIIAVNPDGSIIEPVVVKTSHKPDTHADEPAGAADGNQP